MMRQLIVMPKPFSRPVALSSAIEWLENLAGDRNLVLPTYNYDFPFSNICDPISDRCQVGAIPEFARQLEGWNRTPAPVFSHTSRGPMNFSETNPFGSESLFGILDRAGGQIALVGVGCRNLTFLHYVEELAGVSYRYQKTFKGKIKIKDNWEVTESSWHVRPKNFGLEYDFDGIQSLLIEKGALRQIHPQVLMGNSSEIRDLLLHSMSKDPLYLLDSATRKNVNRELDRLGHAFKLGDFE
jgi:aminoglycoside 3-N-acetyltransferase